MLKLMNEKTASEAVFSVIDCSIRSTVKPKTPSILRVDGGQLLVDINVMIDCKMTEKTASGARGGQQRR